MDLNLVHIVFDVCTGTGSSALLLPHLLDTVRKFGNYFKSVSCCQGNNPCHFCSNLTEFCPYRLVFSQSLSSDPDVVRRHQKPPLPFTFKINLADQSDSCIEIAIVIAGNAIQHVSLFLRAIKLMLYSVSEHMATDIAVAGTWCLDYQGVRHEFSEASGQLLLLSGLEILQAPQHSDAVKIHLDSPLRLLCGGSVSHSFNFVDLLRSQLRRCSSLFAYYGEGELELDFVYLSREAEKVTFLENDFSFMKPHWVQRKSMAGITGVGEFTGLADGMLPLLMLGSYFNAGKGAAYGMGVYRLEAILTG